MKAWPPRQFGGSSPVVTCLRHSIVVWERGEGEAMSGVRRGDGRRGARARTARGTGMRAGGWRAAGLKAAGERRRRVPSCRSRSFRRSCECKQQQQTVAPRSAFLNLRGGAMRARGRGGRAQGERLVKLDDLRVVRREGSDAARGRKGYGCHQRKAHAAGGSGHELWGTVFAPLDRQLVNRRHACGRVRWRLFGGRVGGRHDRQHEERDAAKTPSAVFNAFALAPKKPCITVRWPSTSRRPHKTPQPSPWPQPTHRPPSPPPSAAPHAATTASTRVCCRAPTASAGGASRACRIALRASSRTLSARR